MSFVLYNCVYVKSTVQKICLHFEFQHFKYLKRSTLKWLKYDFEYKQEMQRHNAVYVLYSCSKFLVYFVLFFLRVNNTI